MSEPTSKLIIYGARWCPDVLLTRAHLDRLGIEYDYRDIDRDPEAMGELFALRGKAWVVPTLLLPDGTVLDNPPRPQLKKTLGL
jgi:mycoredoxin